MSACATVPSSMATSYVPIHQTQVLSTFQGCPQSGPGTKSYTLSYNIPHGRKRDQVVPSSLCLWRPQAFAATADICSLGHWGCLQIFPMVTSADRVVWRLYHEAFPGVATLYSAGTFTPTPRLPHQNQSIKCGRGDCCIKCADITHKTTWNTKDQGKMTLPKEHSNLPMTDSKELDIYVLPDKKKF